MTRIIKTFSLKLGPELNDNCFHILDKFLYFLSVMIRNKLTQKIVKNNYFYIY